MNLRNISTEDELDNLLSEPYPEDTEFAESLNSDLLVLVPEGKWAPP
ncbi:MAG TPA: hypothetical protein VKA68_11345 [bacterium]|nr:hypothetical protein [bacterium]